MTTKTPITTAEVQNTLIWHRAVIAEEQRYFAAAGECLNEVAESKRRIAELRETLRKQPTRETWIELAREVALFDAMEKQSMMSPFESRAQRLPLRSGRHPDHREKITRLAAWAKDYATSKLDASRAADVAMTKQLNARDEIVSGPTRELEGILHSVGLVEAQLANTFDSDTGQIWNPFSGLCAYCERILEKA